MKYDKARITRLRNHILVKPSVSLERAQCVTRSYKETEGMEPPYRQAYALKEALENISIKIDEDELLAGRITEYWRGAMILPEIIAQFLTEEMDDLSERATNTFKPIPKEEQEQILDMLSYWKNKELASMWAYTVPEEIMEYTTSGLIAGPTLTGNGHHLTHVGADYEKLLAVGLKGIRQEILDEIDHLDVVIPEDYDKYQYLKAMLISNQAAMDFAERYAVLAEDLAAETADPVRKAELMEMARICHKVPANPADTFYEAVQSIVMVWTVINIEGQGNGLCFGRLDQTLYPFYKKDVEEGILDDDSAKMLLSMLYIKSNGIVNIDDHATSEIFTGWPQTMNVIVGGIDKWGKSAVNELSYICLDADLDVGLTQNDLVVRIHKKNPSAFVLHAVGVAKKLRGKIKFMGDETIIQQMLSDGYSLDDARNYIITGCSTVTVPGRSIDTPGNLINLPMCLELALNDGKRRLDGKQIGLHTGDPRKFTSYEEIWEAYKKQAENIYRLAVFYRSSDREMTSKYRPLPFHSSLFEGPIKKGKDMWSSCTPYSRCSVSPCGAPNVGDALEAIKKVIFEDRYTSMAQLIDALDANFEGYDMLLKKLSDAPKYGNDIDEVDLIVNEVIMHAVEIITPLKGCNGTKMNVSPAALTGNVPLGAVVGALPDGRLAGQPISEGGVSPYQGRNVSGPLATYRSVGKIDHIRCTNGTIFNMRFSPNALKDRESMKKFEQMLRQYLEEGGFFVQYNIVDTKTLRAAQENPDEYRDLLVRVATYSAYFVELGKDLQEDIINRVAMEEMI